MWSRVQVQTQGNLALCHMCCSTYLVAVQVVLVHNVHCPGAQTAALSLHGKVQRVQCHVWLAAQLGARCGVEHENAKWPGDACPSKEVKTYCTGYPGNVLVVRNIAASYPHLYTPAETLPTARFLMGAVKRCSLPGYVTTRLAAVQTSLGKPVKRFEAFKPLGAVTAAAAASAAVTQAAAEEC